MTTEPCPGVVLVVDDEEDTRELLRELLEGHGFRVATAVDGRDALDFIGATPHICLVILDLVMPRMTGLELLEELGREPAGRELAVIVSTSAPDQAPKGLPCLPKPVEIDRLVSIVERHCSERANAADACSAN